MESCCGVVHLIVRVSICETVRLTMQSIFLKEIAYYFPKPENPVLYRNAARTTNLERHRKEREENEVYCIDRRSYRLKRHAIQACSSCIFR